jgi:ribonuclease D
LYILINSVEDLEFLNKELIQRPYLGIDTEFRRTTKDNMRLALLQVNDGDEIYLVDTVSINNPGEYASFLYDNSVIKILHSCKEDLEAVYSWTNKEMLNVFDTQIANSLLKDDYSISYQGLVERELGILLEKKETRSNWLRRPLSDEQLKYAALDVEYLIPLFLEQKKDLIKSSKLEWLHQDIERLKFNVFERKNGSRDLKRIISKKEELDLLVKFNNLVDGVAKENNINSTFFFSKKSQKEFLRLIFFEGMEQACKEITDWRECLIRNKISALLE